jgi:hypothetical protein
MRRYVLPALIATLCLTGIVLTADALVTTEREELDSFVEDVTHDRLDQRVDAALSHVNTQDSAVRVSSNGRISEYTDQAALDEAMRGALSVFDSERQSLLQQSVDIKDSKATVVTRIADSEYEQTVIYDLVRADKRWVVRGVRTL